MPDDPSTPSDPRIETGSRARELPQEAHLRKRFEKFQDFIDMYRSRISLGGAFVDNQVLHPVGAEVYLDFRLEDGYRLLYGLGEVVWVRLVTMSDDRPKGMGLRFLSLDEGGRELVLKLLEEQVKSGGAPFEVDRVPEDGSIDPTVVQALAGPSAEENEAAAKARTGKRPAARPPEELDEPEADEDLPELPPGVLPPPDDEPDFSAPWGEQLPEIPDELLEESATSPGPSIPSVEAPESPYAPGSDLHADPGSSPVAPAAARQADFAFEPLHDGDPHLDETDFGASAWSHPDAAAEEPAVRPLGEATNLRQAQGDPFSDFDTDSVPEVDGTLFQLPESARQTTRPAAPPAAAPTSAPSFETPDFGPSTSFDGGFDAGSAFDVDFGDDADETASQVAPPPDIGDEVGRAWVEDTAGGAGARSQHDDAAMDAALDIGTGDDFAFDPPESDMLGSIDDAMSDSMSEEPAGATSDDGGFDVGGFDAFDVPGFDDEDSGGFRSEEPLPAAPTYMPDFDAVPPAPAPAVAAPAADVDPFETNRAGIATPAAIAKAALGDQLGSRVSQPVADRRPEPARPSTETADDLFAFRGPPDAEPALDPEETASLRGVLPDLSETMMGTKAPSGDDTGGLHHSYDDWHEWAPHPAKSGGRAKVLAGVFVLLLLAAGAGYFFRATLLPMIGFGEGGQASRSSPVAPPPPAAPSETLEPAADDPLAEPLLVAEPDPGTTMPGDDVDAAPASTQAPPSTAADPAPPPTRPDVPAQKPPTTVSAESLRPSSTRTEAPRPSGGVASRVEAIEVRPATGGAEVVIRFDGGITPDRYLHDQLAWAPDKEMIKLFRMENFKQTQIAGDGRTVRQVRVGFHPGNELHLVFDLASNAVSIRGIDARGSELVVSISK